MKNEIFATVQSTGSLTFLNGLFLCFCVQAVSVGGLVSIDGGLVSVDDV